MATHGSRAVATGVEVRPAREDEYRMVAERFELHWETFRWKYLENPWTSSPAIHVLEGNDGLRGAIGWIRLQLACLGGSCESVTPGDLARQAGREGDLRPSIGRGFEMLVRDGVDVAVSAPLPHREAMLPRALDWDSTTRLDTRVFLRQPSAVADRLAIIDPIARRTLDGLLGVRQCLASWTRALTPEPTDIERYDGVPDMGFRILEAADEGGTTAVRSRPFWRWRLADPRMSCATLILFRHGRPVAGAVTGRTDVSSGDVVSILGLATFDADDRALARLVGAVLDDAVGADLVLVPNRPLPAGALERLGVRRTRRWPVSQVVPRRAQQVRVLSEDAGDTASRLGQLGIAERSI